MQQSYLECALSPYWWASPREASRCGRKWTFYVLNEKVPCAPSTSTGNHDLVALLGGKIQIQFGPFGLVLDKYGH